MALNGFTFYSKLAFVGKQVLPISTVILLLMYFFHKAKSQGPMLTFIIF